LDQNKIMIYHKFNGDFKSHINFRGQKEDKEMICNITLLMIYNIFGCLSIYILTKPCRVILNRTEFSFSLNWLEIRFLKLGWRNFLWRNLLNWYMIFICIFNKIFDYYMHFLKYMWEYINLRIWLKCCKKELQHML